MNQQSLLVRADCTCTELFGGKLLCAYAEGFAVEGRCRKMQGQLDEAPTHAPQRPTLTTGILSGTGSQPLRNLNGVMTQDGRDVTAIRMPPTPLGTRVLDYPVPAKGTVIEPVVSPHPPGE